MLCLHFNEIYISTVFQSPILHNTDNSLIWSSDYRNMSGSEFQGTGPLLGEAVVIVHYKVNK